MTMTERQKLIAIHSALDDALGDTDPQFSDDVTDAEIRDEDPIFWAAKEIADMLGENSWDSIPVEARVYGRWAGNPNGILEDVTRCVEAVYGHRDYHSRQCSRTRGHGPDGLYCKQHGKQPDARNALEPRPEPQGAGNG